MSAEHPKFGHIIDGKEVEEGAIKERRNPADGEVVAFWHDGTPEILEQALASAHGVAPAFAALAPRDRAEILLRTARIMEDSRDQFANAMIDEIGKTTTGAGVGKGGEVEKTIRIFKYMAGLPLHTRDMVIPADQLNVHMYTRTEPVKGVAAAIAPFNFPAAVPGWKIASALAAGCPVVFKPSSHAPMISTLLVNAFNKAGLPPGVLNLIHGGHDLVRQLVEDQRVKAVSFTGSTAVGEELYRYGANRRPPLDPRHFVAERGGQNALVVLSDADIEQAVAATLNGAAFGEGQRCTKTSRFVVDHKIYDDFMGRLLEGMAKLKVGPGRNPQNEVGPLVSEGALQDVLKAVRQSIDNGMECLCGGDRLSKGWDGTDLSRGSFMAPTVLKGDPFNPGHLALKQEIFAPVAGVCAVDGLDEAIDVVNSVDHEHAGSIFTKDLRAAFEFARRANIGMVHVNNATIGGDAQAPFGGLGGATSLGDREMGPGCMKWVTRDKTIDINFDYGTVLARGAR